MEHLGKRTRWGILLGMIALGLSWQPGAAATLTSVPMQGGMVMPMVSYNAQTGRMQVMLMNQEVPQLTPLMVSNPGDNFDPADPWFDDLDPSRRGLAFSRRYGFVMNAVTDPLPAGTAMWIRVIAGSPEVSAYRYSSSEPKRWDPIFGTDGEPSALQWNGMMFHPGVTCPPGTNTYAATFEVYLAEIGSGQEVEGSASDPVELVWTSVPDGRPVLSISTRVVISWPASTGDYVLEWTDSVDKPNWLTVTNSPFLLDGKTSVMLNANAATQFYRLGPVE